MAWLGWWILVAVLLAGHTAFWLAMANRLHGTGLSRYQVKCGTWLLRVILLAVPLWVGYLAWTCEDWRRWASDLTQGAYRDTWWNGPVLGYSLLCIVIAVVYLPLWLRDRVRRRPAYRSSKRHLLDIAAQLGTRPLGGWPTRLVSRVPGNQMLKLEVVEHEIELPRLPRRLDGLSLVHLSDLHFSGRVTPPYYHAAMRIVNAWEPDLVLIGGDVCEKVRFIPWIADILGPLQARVGKFFILGNHDVRTRNVPAVRTALTASGYIDLNGVWHAQEVDGARLVLGGDERPWLGRPLDPRGAPPRQAHELRLALLHTPDRLPIAKAADVDLALAGHTHGGQIRLPVIGAIVCPSQYGMRYDAGLFYKAPTTLYVSRGVCALTPLRLNCPPELTRIVLRCPQS